MTTAAKPPRRRRPWLAALLSIFVPGLGQLYNGESRRAVFCFGALTAYLALLVILGQVVDGPVVFLAAGAMLAVAALALLLGSAIDAFRHARRIGAMVLGRYQRLWIYLGVAILLAAAQGTALLQARSHGGCAPGVARVFPHLYEIPSASMEPTFSVGDIFVGESRYFCRNEPRRGDLAVFLHPKFGETIYLKRIIGLPGDRIQVKEGHVHINGDPVSMDWLESGIGTDDSGAETHRTQFVETFPDGARYIVEIRDLDSKVENTPEIIVPADSYFVLGDNRDNSLDSRMGSEFGFIPRTLIVDRPAFIIWSSDWGRIGLRLR